MLEEIAAIIDANPCQGLAGPAGTHRGFGFKPTAALIGEEARGIATGRNCALDFREEIG